MFNRYGRNAEAPKKEISSRCIIRGLLLALIFFIVGTFVLTYEFLPSDVADLTLGDVAPRDIMAPRQIVYTSEIQTEAERNRARNSVSTIYTQPDPQVARQQINRLRQIFDYLESVRADPYGTLAEKSEWIAAIPELQLSDAVVDEILIMNDKAWSETRQEARAVLDQIMRAEIRENQVMAMRRQLPTRVALDTPDNQALVIVAVVEKLIKPNTFPDEERTEAERQAAVDAVNPVVVTFEENELIVSGGQIVGVEEVEALQALGLQQTGFSWLDVVAPAVLLLLTTIMAGAYLVQHVPRILTDGTRLILLTVLVLVFIIVAKFMIPARPVVAYLYPVAALSMMVVILIDGQLAFIVTTIIAFLAAYVAPDGFETTVFTYLVLSGWTGVLALGRSQRVNALLWSGLYVGIINAALILIFNLSKGPFDLVNLGVLLLEGLLNGIFAAGLASVGLFAIGSLLGITTSIQLLELARPTHPLLRQLLLKAPGTYHHSLMVSNLVEQAAERIDANALLVRVMAYYHDVGKMQRPYFFIENQPEGINVHEKLDAQISAQIIISHVKDGLDLANKYHLPQAIKDGIAQHHGTSLVKYFYYQAMETAKEKQVRVDETNFHYPGPRPQNKENGILMLADVSESTVRALKPGSAEEIQEIVSKVIADKLNSGQLDDCELTIAELHNIRSAFVDILQGVHHPRIKYPDQLQAEAEEKPGTEAVETAEPEKAGKDGAKPEEQKEKPAGVKAPAAATPAPLPQVSATRPARLVRRE